MPEVAAWVAESGFTLDELASIQPGYMAPIIETWQVWDPANGRPKWNTTQSGIAYGWTPAVGTDGTVYVASQDGMVYALHGENGQLRWSYRVASNGSSVTAPPVLGDDDTVYVTTSGDLRGHSNGTVWALNGQTGAPRWSSSPSIIGFNWPTLGTDGTLFAKSSDGTVYAFSALTGSVMWNVALGIEDTPDFPEPAVGADGTVYLLDERNSRLAALNGNSGAVLWSATAGTPKRKTAPNIHP